MCNFFERKKATKAHSHQINTRLHSPCEGMTSDDGWTSCGDIWFQCTYMSSHILCIYICWLGMCSVLRALCTATEWYSSFKTVSNIDIQTTSAYGVVCSIKFAIIFSQLQFEKSKSHAFKCNCMKNLRIIHTIPLCVCRPYAVGPSAPVRLYAVQFFLILLTRWTHFHRIEHESTSIDIFN